MLGLGSDWLRGGVLNYGVYKNKFLYCGWILQSSRELKCWSIDQDEICLSSSTICLLSRSQYGMRGGRVMRFGYMSRFVLVNICCKKCVRCECITPLIPHLIVH